MEIKHFSHRHPLILNEVPKDDGEEEVKCYGCRQRILGSTYSCSLCNFFLHKRCAELTKEVKHPMHRDHSLTLFVKPPNNDSGCSCNVCHDYWCWFTYNCKLCEFDICLPCALEERLIDHKSHHHPLTLLKSSAFVDCDACGTKAEDLFYLCTTCLFWIHKTCALSPNTFRICDHDHPLELAYSIPYEFRNFTHTCDICRQKVHPAYWVYCCVDCRYFAHVKCALAPDQNPSTLRGGNEEDHFDLNMMHFPVLDESVDLVCQFFKAICLGDDEKQPKELSHFSHHHPLVIFDIQSNNDQLKNDETLCGGCLRRILSIPFYGCGECNYFLHTRCANLPPRLQHPFHLEHPSYPEFSLKISKLPNFFDYFSCDVCKSNCTGFSFWCEYCQFQRCIRCAGIPSTIKHEAHNHPLVQNRLVNCQCNACGKYVYSFKYGCDGCGFNLDSYCAMLPQTARHEWDHHPLTLIYPPFNKHPDEFICEICEEDIHPKYWLYHCRKCDQSFHTRCIYPDSGYSNVEFGGTLKVDKGVSLPTTIKHEAHKHPLVRGLDSEHMCSACGYYIPVDDFRTGCDACGFNLDSYCATLPGTVRHECDPHPITLIYPPFGDHLEEFICQICKEDIHPKYWLYHCRSCNQSFHTKCLRPVDKNSNIKFGGTLEVENHPHPLTFVPKSKSKYMSQWCDCGNKGDGDLVFECAPCNFILCLSCARKLVRLEDELTC